METTTTSRFAHIKLTGELQLRGGPHLILQNFRQLCTAIESKILDANLKKQDIEVNRQTVTSLQRRITEETNKKKGCKRLTNNLTDKKRARERDGSRMQNELILMQAEISTQIDVLETFLN